MTLASFEQPAESNKVLDFLGGTCMKQNLFRAIRSYFQFKIALFGTPIMTSIKRADDDFQWLNGLAASVLNWATDQPAKSAGNCASLLENLFSTMPCEQPTNFMCESPDLQG